MSMTVLVAQLFALVAFILYTTSLQFKKMNKVLKYQIVANIFYVLEYLMLNAYSGVNNSLFGISRCCLFYALDKKKKKCPAYIALIFITLVIIFGYISYTDFYSTIPVLISIIFFLALYTEDMRLYRIVAAVASALWIVYNVHVNAYIGILDSVVELISASVAIYRFDIKKKTFLQKIGMHKKKYRKA